MTAEEFVDQLEQSDLLPREVVEKIRKQIGSARRPLNPQAVAKWLVDKGHLTAFQVKRLLPEEPPAETQSEQTPPAEDELGLAPLEEDEPKTPAAKKEPPPKKKPKKSAPVEKVQAPASAAPQATDSPQSTGIVEDELSPLGALDALDEAALDAGNPLMPTTSKKKGLKKLLSLPKSDEPEIKAHDEPKSHDTRTRTLITVVSGLFVGLSILLAVLYYAITGTSATEMLQKADESYEQGSYGQAIEEYDQFLKEFPDHEEASRARVFRGLARLRQKVEGGSDWEAALATAQEVLEEIKDEDDFPKAQAELATLLPDIAEGLAKEARELAVEKPAEADKKVVLFDQAMLLVNNRDYIPNSVRSVGRIEDIEGLVRVARKKINQDARLIETLAMIDAAIAQNQPDEAYQARKSLLTEYPDIEQDPRLVAKMKEIAAAEKNRITVTPGGAKAIRKEPASSVLSVTALAATRAGQLGRAPGVDGRVVFALAEGAAYGLDAASGEVLWRRFVGFDTQMLPTPIEPPAGGDAPPVDALLVDSVRNEVVRVVARSGQLVWRHPVGEPFDDEPLLLDDRILVSTNSGRLLTLDATSGDALFSAKLPQKLRVSPGGDPRKGYVYLTGEHSNLYVMSLSDGSCRETVFLGHDPGSVTVPPLVVQRFVMVIENRGHDLSWLHVLATDVSGLPVGLLPKPLPIKGQVNVPLLNLGQRGRFMLITDRGRMVVYTTPVGRGTELRLVAEQPAAGERPLVHYPYQRRGELWLASDQLARYDIQYASREFQARETRSPGEFTQPLQVIGKVLFHARRKPGTPGVIVSAMQFGGQKETLDKVDYWQTHLAAPPAAAPFVSNNRVVAVTAPGDVYEIPLEDKQAPAVMKPLVVASSPKSRMSPLVARIDLEPGVAMFVPGSGGTHVLRYDANATANRATWVTLELPDGDTLSSVPGALAGGLLAPGAKGQVYLLNAVNGSFQAAPYQPQQSEVGQFAWRRPDAASFDSTQAVLSDGHAKLYVLNVKQSPMPHLVATAAGAELGDRVTSPVALIGSMVFAVDAGGILHAMKLPNLDHATTIPLDSPAKWGPRRVGKRVLLSTRDNQLVCLADDEQRLQWQIDLPYGPLAGAPIAVGDDFIITSNQIDTTGGVISRIDAATGDLIATIELSQPLGSGAVLHDGQLFVLTHDGSLLRTPLPSP